MSSSYIINNINSHLLSPQRIPPYLQRETPNEIQDLPTPRFFRNGAGNSDWNNRNRAAWNHVGNKTCSWRAAASSTFAYVSAGVGPIPTPVAVDPIPTSIAVGPIPTPVAAIICTAPIVPLAVGCPVPIYHIVPANSTTTPIASVCSPVINDTAIPTAIAIATATPNLPLWP